MNKKILIPVVSGVIIAIILIGILSSTEQKPITTQKPTPPKPMTEPIPTRDQVPVDIPLTNQTANGTAQIPITPIILSYDSNSALKSQLASKGISMSTPLKISGGAIAKYCIFYSNAEKQNSIQYCTSTELKDSEGKFLGNIHMFGSANSPDAVLGVVQTDPYMSNLDSLKITYQMMVESLVCDCWQDQKPGNLESVSAWIDAAKSHHLEATGTTSSSKLSGLAQKQLILEVTTNTEGYLWKFIISN
ncbi:MAG TPA: hypothetical protein VFN17_07610 [Nitrosarchaeum sp.]|nr:hypothetical protein [Nitrosarchaeum sp.]